MVRYRVIQSVWLQQSQALLFPYKGIEGGRETAQRCRLLAQLGLAQAARVALGVSGLVTQGQGQDVQAGVSLLLAAAKHGQARWSQRLSQPGSQLAAHALQLYVLLVGQAYQLAHVATRQHGKVAEAKGIALRCNGQDAVGEEDGAAALRDEEDAGGTAPRPESQRSGNGIGRSFAR